MSKTRDETMVTINGTSALVSNMGSDVAIVVTHPWSFLGGNMYNNVVTSLVRFFQSLSVTTLRFNFYGGLGRGHTQVAQLQECCRWLCQNANIVATRGSPKNKNCNPSSILLIGYSYGALIAGSALASVPECVGYCGIATPFGVSHWLTPFSAGHHLANAAARPRVPRLLLQGSEDGFTEEAQFSRKVAGYPADATTAAVLPGADHFFRGKERVVAGAISQWMLASYPELRRDLSNLADVTLRVAEEEEGGEEPEKGTVAEKKTVRSICGWLEH
eukprot:CAMPEP_0113307714 /NCGR_PEP_ID=MMETSP0010_2-20120614/6454_1 /TAXON_ID=216773 ORGANISM="Corethron hystrix, Strain 308" /NCGR_SAMPLE_ID=MMETSP0010_2 /ASSEMBLY_ACC=CAM_ASM_000155 /LENGTH=273 /DNA_ID=CAMNT_0000162635 /DNA_START=114 /DNA_END=935 /DNA_ORIENTATION=+ /assembly_acc=CAM_ASM_000155